MRRSDAKRSLKIREIQRFRSNHEIDLLWHGKCVSVGKPEASTARLALANRGTLDGFIQSALLHPTSMSWLSFSQCHLPHTFGVALTVTVAPLDSVRSVCKI